MRLNLPASIVTELDAMEKQAMELLDHGDVHGAIRLYEEMKLDSAMTLKIAVRQEAKEDMKLLLPSLVNNFQLLKQAMIKWRVTLLLT